MKLTLVTPGKRIVLGEEVSEITLPAFMGELNILPGHQPLITTLTPGVIRYKLKDGIEVAASISWGYCNISPEGVNVLAETVESANDIDFEATKEGILICLRIQTAAWCSRGLDLRGAGVPAADPDRRRAGHRQVAGARRADLEGRRGAARQGLPHPAPQRPDRARCRSGLGHRDSADRTLIPEGKSLHSIRDRARARVHHARLQLDLDVHRREHRAVARKTAPSDRRKGRRRRLVGADRRREPDGRADRGARRRGVVERLTPRCPGTPTYRRSMTWT